MGGLEPLLTLLQVQKIQDHKPPPPYRASLTLTQNYKSPKFSTKKGTSNTNTYRRFTTIRAIGKD